MDNNSIGRPVVRFEDDVLLRGHGSFTDDVFYPSQCWMTVVRSPYAAARIDILDLTAARKASGVLGAYSFEDLNADGIGIISFPFPFKRSDGSDMICPPYPLLASGYVRCVGDPIAIVIAETLAQAQDAAELANIEFSELPAVADAVKAMETGAPLVWDEIAGNISFVLRKGDRMATEAAFDKAAHRVSLDLNIPRVTACSLEPRGAVGIFDPDNGRYELRAGTQAPHRLKNVLAEGILHVPPEDVRVISPNIGGAFGMKNNPYPEYALVLWAAKKTGRPVAWRSSRNEAFQSDYQGRDNRIHAELALDREGNFTGLRVRNVANLGAYLSLTTPHSPTANIGGMVGPYRIPAADVEVIGVHTHTPPTAPYRGAGRPEATYVIERLVDTAARELGLDRADIRRRNMLTVAELPKETALGFIYDCGDFPAVLDHALAEADWAGFPARQTESTKRGLRRGLGLAYSVEIAGGPQGAHMPEFAELRLQADGQVRLLAGSKEIGTGYGTAFRQILADRLGLTMDRISIIDGDTDEVTQGTGSFGSRTLAAGGTAVVKAGELILEKARPLAAEVLEVAEVDLEFESGAFRIAGTDRSIGLMQLVEMSGNDLTAPVMEKTGGPSFPNGCHICEVEIDTETGTIDIVDYTVVDDVGTVVNPLLLKGQLQGGIVQGLGTALGEEIVFGNNDGQLLTGSFMDYGLPRAADMPAFTVISHPVPTKNNLLGSKGAGEAGTVGAAPALVSAVLNALEGLGVTHVDIPLTPLRMREAIERVV